MMREDTTNIALQQVAREVLLATMTLDDGTDVTDADRMQLEAAILVMEHIHEAP